MSITLPTHASLLDPATGEPLVALGVRADGSAIWPMLGGAPDDEDEDSQDEPPADADAEKPADSEDPGDGDDEDDEVPDETWDAKRLLAANKKARREAANVRKDRNKLRQEAATRAADLAELEQLRDEKRSEKEKLEHKASQSEQTAAEARAENERLKIMLATGVVDDDEFDDLKIKGDTFEDRKASALKFAEKYRLGKFTAEEGSPKSPKTPGPTNLKGGLKPNEVEEESDPGKLAAAIPRGF